MLRTAFWNQTVAAPLHEDPIALNLIYIETIADIKKGWIVVDDDVADDLAQFRAQKDRESFLKLAKGLKVCPDTDICSVDGGGGEWCCFAVVVVVLVVVVVVVVVVLVLVLVLVACHSLSP
jgi:hypothetical protein